jgi:hypothetical protein
LIAAENPAATLKDQIPGPDQIFPRLAYRALTDAQRRGDGVGDHGKEMIGGMVHPQIRKQPPRKRVFQAPHKI